MTTNIIQGYKMSFFNKINSNMILREES